MTLLLTCACGNQFEVADAARGQFARCPGCGRDVPVPGSGTLSQPDTRRGPAPEPATTRRPRVPEGSPAGGPAAGALPGGPGRPKTSRWAVTGLVVGLLSFGLFALGLLLAPRIPLPQPELTGLLTLMLIGLVWLGVVGVTAVVAIVLGILGVVDIRSSRGQRRGMGAAIAGIVIPILPVILVPLGLMLWQRVQTRQVETFHGQTFSGPRPTTPAPPSSHP